MEEIKILERKMEVNSGLVVGSHNQNELMIIRRNSESLGISLQHARGNESESNRHIKICQICEDEVGVNIDGEVFVACNECAFPICKTCYEYERLEGSQVCPNCKTRLKRLKGHARVEGDEEEDDIDDLENELNYSRGRSEQQLAKSAAGIMKNWNGKQERLDEDHSKNLGVNKGHILDPPLIGGPSRQTLSRKVPVSSRQINPYRMIIIIRLVVLGFFFHYRVTHPVYDAYALWLVSVICEIWFALSWILDQFSNWLPVERETYLDRLSLRYEKEGEPSQLSPVDIFLSSVDPLKDPPLVTANTVLSILAVDYPVDKVSCYVSDDGAAMLTFEALSETSEFARKWVPFCKKYNLEPRAPEWYFSHNLDYFNDKILPPFVKERRAMKREYDEFKVRINSLVVKARMAAEEEQRMQDGSLWPGNDVCDHPGIIQVLLGQDEGHENDDQSELPRLVYVAREKRPGFNHQEKAGAMNALVRVSGVLSNAPYLLKLECDNYINNSKTLKEAMCFMMDPHLGKRLSYVQFPHGNANTTNTLFCNTRMKGLDGIQGPICLGSGCVFRRRALYGYDAPQKRKPQRTRTCCGSEPLERNYSIELGDAGTDQCALNLKCMEKTFGQSPMFVSSTLLQEGGIPTAATSPSLLEEAIHVSASGYEEKTEWGREFGWIYGSVAEDMLTGLKMHCNGWRSVYCVPATPAFEGSIAMNNLSDHLHQVFHSAIGSMEIFFSSHCPLWYGYGRGLKWFQRLSYINVITYPWTSIPLLVYSTLPVICLMTSKFIIPEVGGVGSLCFLSLFLCILVHVMLEMRWSGVGIDEWWRNQQFWVIGGVSGHLFVVFHELLKVLVGLNSKLDVDNSISLLVLPTTLLIVNMIGVVIGVSNAISNGYESLRLLLGKLLFGLWVILHLYPLFGRQKNKNPTIAIVWSVSLASMILISLSWLRIDPFLAKPYGPTLLEECGLECN